MTWRRRSSPHSGDHTFLDKDGADVWIENCLQCGYEAVLKKVDGKLQIVKPIEKLDVRQAVMSR